MALRGRKTAHAANDLARLRAPCSASHPPHPRPARLAKLTPQHVHSLVTQKVREGRLSPRTIQYMHSVLRAALNQAVRWRMVHYNAAAMVSTPRVTRREVLALTPEAARRLLDAARG